MAKKTKDEDEPSAAVEDLTQQLVDLSEDGQEFPYGEPDEAPVQKELPVPAALREKAPVAAAPEAAAEEAPEPEATEPDAWDPNAIIVPEGDVRYPRFFWGKPLAEMLHAQDEANKKVEQSGREKNEAQERARIYETLLNNLAAKTPAPPQQEQQNYYSQQGLNPETDLIDRPEALLDAAANRGRALALQEITPQLQAVQQKQTEYENERQLNMVRAAHTQAHAQLQAEGYNLPAEEWNKAGGYLWAAAGQNPFDPNAWTEAFKQMPGSAMFLSGQAPPREGVTRGTPPGGTRNLAVKPNAPNLRPRVRTLLNDTVDGLPSELKSMLTPEKMAQIEADLQAQERR